MSFQFVRKMLQCWLPPCFHPAGAAKRGLTVAPGLHHFVYELAGEPTRFHLRVDGSGHGVLVANATAAVRLRPSGVLIAKGLLEGDDDSVLFDRLRRTFQVSADEARRDIRSVLGLIHQLTESAGDYPMIQTADLTVGSESEGLAMPLSADVSLAAPERMVPLLNRLWELGIPHVTIIAGRQPDAGALVRAVERAEDLGMIAGVRGSGSVLGQGSLIRDLAQAGLDHLNIFYFAADAELHDSLAGVGDHSRAVEAFRLARKNDVCPVAEMALTRATADVVDVTIRSLQPFGVETAAVFALASAMQAAPSDAADAALAGDSLIQVAATVEETADAVGVRVLSYPPVEFCWARTLAEQSCEGPRASGDTAVRIEPDGTVIPARGPCQSAGNLLTDPWPRIWQSEAFRQYRARVEHDTRCDRCPGLAVCRPDCPRSPQGWARASLPLNVVASPQRPAAKEHEHEA